MSHIKITNNLQQHAETSLLKLIIKEINEVWMCQRETKEIIIAENKPVDDKTTSTYL